MFLQDGIFHDGRSMETTVYMVTEGDEPTFFSNFFDWDSSKQSAVRSEHTHVVANS
jgi:advillin